MLIHSVKLPFHGFLDTLVGAHSSGFVDVTERQYVVVQERSVRYHVTLHEHPFVQQLTRRLLQQGLKGLQAADTEYAPGSAALPGSVEVAVAAATTVSLAPGGVVAVVALPPGTAPGVLTTGTSIELTGAVDAQAADEVRATLESGMDALPAIGGTFPVPSSGLARAAGGGRVVLAAAVGARLPDGTAAAVPAGATVRLRAGTQVGLPPGTAVTLLARRPRPVLYEDAFFPATYAPSPLVQRPYPAQDLDFTSGGAYAGYNWELFFHVPLTIAIQLSKNQRFADAQRWFHYIFDPTDDSDGPTPQRFWKLLPFHRVEVQNVETLLVNLSTGADEQLRDETIRSINAWKSTPFRPHAVARFRQQAYMTKTVMAYLDNLIAWGDSLFRQDSGEAIDEALQLYVMAANILGPRPQLVPQRNVARPRTYANLSADLDRFGNAMVDVESELPFLVAPFPADAAGDDGLLANVHGLGRALYFCVPRNDKLLSYWDTVADRLFKMRNSLNLQGIFRQLPLFEPPIDPALLARAAAAGLDVEAVVSGLAQPLPLVRFQRLVQEAGELAQEVRTLGAGLLQAMEKEDMEALTVLRAKHEHDVMTITEPVRYGQLQEATKAKEALLKSLALVVQRYTFFERQLNQSFEEIARSLPELTKLDRDSLYKMRLVAIEPEVTPWSAEPDTASDLGESGGVLMSSREAQELVELRGAQSNQDAAADIDMIAKGLSLIPDFIAAVHPIGIGADVQFGGRALSTSMSLLADRSRSAASRHTHEAGRAARIAAYARRTQEWEHQSNQAGAEITQIFKQLRAAEIREAIAERELVNHQAQMKHAEEIELFLNADGAARTGKQANQALYAWIKREVKGLYAQSFQIAFDAARKAERALQRELGDPALTFLQPGYLGGKEGLLAGERLALDVKRMTAAHRELNQREYELTKHVSLLQVAPLALLQLRRTGRCTVELPEEVFDLDAPGHFFRRIKTVALSIPCVTGPYASLNCRLSLLRSDIRTTPILGDGGVYAAGDDDPRIDRHYGSLQSIVASSAQADSGLFEVNLHDERYLPFEGCGVVSQWALELPADPSGGGLRQFDYDTISDVILHIRYTAREGGDLLRERATADLMKRIANEQPEDAAPGCVRLLSVRHEFGDQWAALTAPAPPVGDGAPPAPRHELVLPLRDAHYPFWSHHLAKTVKRVAVVARAEDTIMIFDSATADAPIMTLEHPRPGTSHDLADSYDPKGLSAVEDLRLYLDGNDLTELWVALTWRGTPANPTG
jgi:hypothetical protein